MRDNLYLWMNSEEQYLFASGIEFRDVACHLGPQRGMILLEHQFANAYHTDIYLGHFDFITANLLPELMREDIYSWGDFTWIDYQYSGDGSIASSSPTLSEREITELQYFLHKAKPLERISLPGLKNRFFYRGHDDGWKLLLYYNSWFDIKAIVEPLLSTFCSIENPGNCSASR